MWMSLWVNLINFVLELKKFFSFFFLNYCLESPLFLAYFHYGIWFLRIQNDFSDSKTDVDAVPS